MPLGVRVVADLAPIPAIATETQTRNATLKAVRAGIKIIQAAAKGAAPKRRGHLKRAQGTKAVKGKKGKTGSFAVQGAKTKYVKTDKKSGKRVVPAFYDHLVIGGVKPHSVREGSLPHPGHSANPYRQRAYQSVKAQVGAAVLRVMGIEVNKILAKAAAKLKGKK